MASIFSSGALNSSSASARKVLRNFNESSVYPVVEPERLLSSVHRMQVLQEIKDIVALPDEYFDSLYHGLIVSFAAFVQILPVNNESRLSSILDEGLLRALFALQVQQKSSKGEVEPLMVYVLFSACLLFDVACVIENRTISVSEQGGSFIRLWNPICEGSLPIGGYYRIRKSGGFMPWSCRRSAVSLASKLLPQVGLDWIFENSHAFNVWISLLSDDREGAGVLSFSIDRAREMLEEFKTTNEYFIQQINIEEFEPTDTKEAELFLAWYLQELEKGNLSLLKVADDKVLITQDMIERYARVHKEVSLHDIVEELGKLGVIDGEVGSFYILGHKAQQSVHAKRQALGEAFSLFGFGKEVVSETVGKSAGELASEKVSLQVSPEDQLKSGKVDSYVVSLTQGMVVLPQAGINVMPTTAEQQLALQMPALNDNARLQDSNSFSAKPMLVGSGSK